MTAEDTQFKLETMPPYSGIVISENPNSLPLIVKPYIQVQIPNPLPIEINSKNEISSTQVIASLALFVSVLSIFLNIYLNKKARERAIVDEFWIRKVIYPDVVQPLFDFIKTTIKEIPSPTKKHRSAFITKYQTNFENDISDHSKRLNTFGLIDRKLYISLNLSFEEIEDLMAVYTHSLTQPLNQSQIDHHQTLISALEKYQLSLIKNIKKYQDNL